MLADFYITRLSNDMKTEKSYSGSTFVQKFGPFYQKRRHCYFVINNSIYLLVYLLFKAYLYSKGPQSPTIPAGR